MLLACGEQGLWRREGVWRREACPLQRPSLLAQGAVADVHGRLAWDGRRVFALPPGVERILRCRWGWAVLSGEADSLSLLDGRGQLLLTAPAGVYPQGMCLLPCGAALVVCGGAEGTVRILSLPDMQLLRRMPLPGSVQQAACAGDALCVLSLVEEGGLRCRASLVSLRTGVAEAVLTLPGLPGAVCADGLGGWWVAASERLCRLDCRGRCLCRQEDWGLITCLTVSAGALLAVDTVLGLCALMRASDGGEKQILFRGEVQHALFLNRRQEMA